MGFERLLQHVGHPTHLTPHLLQKSFQGRNILRVRWQFHVYVLRFIHSRFRDAERDKPGLWCSGGQSLNYFRSEIKPVNIGRNAGSLKKNTPREPQRSLWSARTCRHVRALARRQIKLRKRLTRAGKQQKRTRSTVESFGQTTFFSTAPV